MSPEQTLAADRKKPRLLKGTLCQINNFHEGMTMSWIKTVPYAQASEELKKIYDETKEYQPARLPSGKFIDGVRIHPSLAI